MSTNQIAWRLLDVETARYVSGPVRLAGGAVFAVAPRLGLWRGELDMVTGRDVVCAIPATMPAAQDGQPLTTAQVRAWVENMDKKDSGSAWLAKRYLADYVTE